LFWLVLLDGQTGSGKTYTMFGEGHEIRGIIPRSVEYLFQSLAKRTSTSEVAMVCSFLEIYNDQIRDLGKAYLAAMGVENNTSAAMHEKTSDLFEKLAGKRGNPYFAPAFHKTGSAMAQSGEMELRPGLKEVQDEYNTMNYEIREDNEGNVFVKDLSLVPVTTMEEVMSLISTGLRVRATHETKMNSFSSRSHTVFTITVLQRDKMTGEAITGMLNLVDLAGSERLKKSESIGVRLKEALHINTSLTALGKVIMALDPSKENSHIPYRDSKLTRVLQNSLGGNSFTTVIATVHPSAKYYEECLSSLQFANRCRNVRNNPRVNYVEDTEDKDRKIRKLMEEIGSLRSKMTQLTGNDLYGGRGAAAGAGAAAGKLSVSALVALLKRLGIAATVAPDGSLLVNGQKFSTDDIGLGGEGGDALGDGKAGGGKEGGGGATVEKLQKVIKELKESNANYSMKSKERKQQMEEQGRQMQKMSVELLKLQTGMRHKEFECKTLSDDKERSLSEMKAFLEGKYAEDLQGMINHNREVMNAHQADIDKIPAALMEFTKLYAKTEKEKSELETPLRAEFSETLKKIDHSRLGELSHVRSQFDFWLEEKDKALSGFVDAFNAYRNKKSEQLRMAEKEIVKLYEYYEELDNCLTDAKRGKFYMRPKDGIFTSGVNNNTNSRPNTAESAVGNGTGVGSVNGGGTAETNEGSTAGGLHKGYLVIPKSETPANPFKAFGPSTLALTRKIIAKHKEREERLNKMKSDALQKSIHFAAQSSKHKGADATLEGNVRDFLVTRNAQIDPTQPISELIFAAKGAQRASASQDAKLVKSLNSTGFGPTKAGAPHPTPYTRPKSAGTGRLHATAGQQPQPQPQQPEERAGRTGGVSGGGSGIAADGGKNQRRSPAGMVTAPGGLEGRSHSDPWDDSRSASPTNRAAQAQVIALEKANRELAAELEKYQSSERTAKVFFLFVFRVTTFFRLLKLIVFPYCSEIGRRAFKQSNLIVHPEA
jgi:hypothetical protein